MKLGYYLQYGGDPRAAAEQVTAFEEVGLDVVWVAEAYGFDSPTLMGYLAATTERIEIGSAIVNIYSRTPSAIAQTAAGLDNVSRGRAILGLGASGPQVIEGFHGVPYDRPLVRTREVIEVVRAALRREVLEFDGATVTLPLPPDEGTGLGKPLKLLNRPERDRIPIYIASLGPRNVAMTAEIADGWLPTLWLPEHATEAFGEALTAGRAKRDPSLGPLEIVAGGLTAIAEGPTRDQLLDLARPMVALYVGGMGARGRNFYNDLFARYGYEQEARTIQDLYLDGKKDEAAAAVPDEVLGQMNLVGSEGQIKERIAAFRESGVTTLNVMPFAEDPTDLLAKVKEWIS